MHASPEILAAIRQLRAEKKFVEEGLYPGAPDEDTRLRCEANVNWFLDEFVALLARGASKEQLLSCAKAMLDSFAEEDTEEREETDTYIGEVMRAVGIEDWTDFI
jgi:hypothetical protein